MTFLWNSISCVGGGAKSQSDTKYSGLSISFKQRLLVLLSVVDLLSSNDFYDKGLNKKIKNIFTLLFPGSPQLPSEYEANPELLFYRITHLNHRQQYLIWAAAVTTAGKGNFSDKVTVEPAAKGESPSIKGNLHVRRIILYII